ncbi:CRISPR-associated helicase Cas3' [Kitasatospora kifunensis]|uniref:CRISPR-associated endonuclease/helicase Cas3 n=1 Tax=Kitasatospora kifunensis TaxID=58351 RepID=A0A7W7RBC3_KITKI|nr:CRISPR-associated helicase Cas3' [Kitasatospora kifunensis]MBB4928852.1 CRISPR-associated endonuclease/helicase Cas3 [Kitasatospora kifunensis]
MDRQKQYLPAWYFIWGKTDKHGLSRRGGGPAWNPLLAHVLDTAACAGELWGRLLSPGVRARFAEAFGAGDQPTARKVVMLLAALHDLGKGSGCFLHQFGTHHRDDAQLRGPAREDWERLARKAGLPLSDAPGSRPQARHEHITAAHLPRFLGCPGEDCGGTGECARGLHAAAALLGGHHGHIPDLDTIDSALGAVIIDGWEPIHRGLVQEAAELIGVDLAALPALVAPVRPSVLPLFTGLVVLADWLASDQDHFTYRTLDRPAPHWWRASQRKALRSVKALRLGTWTPHHADWPELFPDTTTPRPFQRATMRAMPASGPAMVVVESDTGSGKTRLAMWCAHYLAVTCGYQGQYLAMPTRAATTQAANEYRKFIPHSLGTRQQANLALVDSAAEGMGIVHQLLEAARLPQQARFDRLEPSITDTLTSDRTEALGRAVLSPWYLRRCLGVVSGFAVGTVDQVVLAAQASRHWMVRLLGLAVKTVIIDEAHAYELFQQEMLAATVEWLADAGASVVVLSATLPVSVRHSLVNAWCAGQRVEPKDDGRLGPITVVDQHGSITHAAPELSDEEREASRLRTRLDLLPDPGPAVLVHRLLREASGGGITVVIRNRAEEAVALHTAVLGQAEQLGWRLGWREDEIMLLHEGFLGRHRLPLEETLVNLVGLGPKGTRNPRRPTRLLVIADQVVEQSVDIDFDRLYTDLAPIDLLIQRRGRLHRHRVNDAGRPAWCAEPQLTVLWRPDVDGLPIVEPPAPDGDQQPGNLDGLVYAPYALAATWRVLTERADAEGVVRLVTPDHNSPLIEAVYAPTGVGSTGIRTTGIGTTGIGTSGVGTGPLAALLQRTWDAWQRALKDGDAEAGARSFRPYVGPHHVAVTVSSLVSGRDQGEGEEGGMAGLRALTRLGNPTIEALALYRQDSGSLTYDPEGHARADLHRNHSGEAARLRQQQDFLLNTLAVPGYWFTDDFTDETPLPAPATWPVSEHRGLRDHHVLLFDRFGSCVSGPRRLSYDPVTGLSR